MKIHAHLIKVLAVALLAVSIPAAYADQGGFTNTGSSTNPPGTLTIGATTVTWVSSDGTTSINATITTSSNTESCSGGGRGGHVSCAYTFIASFSGTLTANGLVQAINGSTNQYEPVGGTSSGTTGYNSAYTPFYYSDSEQILRADDLQGTNQITYGSQGSGVGQFYGAYGIAVDSYGRIYVVDTYNDRIVRIDDMNGTNWITYGTYGSGPGQFNNPSGIAVDSTGRIYVMDTGNARLVSMDDMTGTNWQVFGTVGSGVGQFASFTSVAVDSLNRIYVADGGNRQIVRMDDMAGTNWTTLSQSPVINSYIYSFGSPVAVTVDLNGRIYVADNGSYAPEVVRVDDMTGANWTSIYVSPTGSTGLNSIAVDSTGTLFTGGGGVKLVDSMFTVQNSSGTIAPYGTYYVFGVTPVPLPTPRPSAIKLAPVNLDFTQNVGTSSSQSVTITNFGGSPLDLTSFSASGGFTDTSYCPNQLVAGSNCTVSVTFTPSVTGPVSGSLIVNDDSGNAGAAQTVALTGTGTAPIGTATPASISFSSQVVGTTSTAKSVTLQNTGTGPMGVASVSASAPFSQTNTCVGSIIAPAASCTISVSFTPTVVGSASGSVTIADDAGVQSVSLTGTGSAPVTFSSSTLSFGTLAAGSTSAAKTLTVTNRGGALTFSSIAASGDYAISSNTCGTGIAAGANCTVGVTFTPSVLGADNGTLTFIDSALTSPQSVSLTGTGSAPVTLSASSLSLGTVAVGNTSAAKTVTLTNHENVALGVSSIAASGDYAVASNTCGASVAAGATCTVGVTLTPSVIGADNGTLTFTDAASNSPQTVSLTGTGSAPVTLSASSLSLGTVAEGNTSAAKTVTLTNHLSVALGFSSIAASGDYAVASNTCGASVAAGATCTVGVKLTPSVIGADNGTLTFTDSALTSPQTVSLTGTGSTPVTLSSTSLSFGTVTVGTTSSAKTVTVTNNQNVSLSFSSILTSASFAVSSNTCGTSIAAGAKCTVGVTFKPTATGAVAGSLTLTDSATNSPQSVSLTGTGK